MVKLMPWGDLGALLPRGFSVASVLALAMSAQALAAQDSAADRPAGQDPVIDEVPAPPPGVELPAVEPVISDEEFQKEIPELDPADDAELDAPLESIDEFERRVAAEQADAAPAEGQEAPLGDPALADQDTTEEIGDAPIRDAELAAPLPPLGEFDVQPVQIAEDDSDQEVTEVAYSVQVNGLEEADEEAATDLTGMFDDLSALRDADGKAANVAQVSARLTEDSALLKRILASEGWYEAAVNTRVDRSEEVNGQPLTAVLDVVPGKRFTFAQINLDAPPVQPPDLLEKNFAIQVGEPIVAERVQGAEAKLAVTLPENGYPFAEIGQRDILLDQDTGDGIYTLPIDTGPRSRFGGIETTGDLAFDADHVEVLSRFERGELYDSRDVDDLRQALVATGLFNTVSVTPERSGEDAGDGTEYATILVEQEAGPPRTIAGSAGYGTGQGFRLEGSWTHRNLFPPEGALIGSAVAGTREQSVTGTFRRSNAGRRDRTFQVTAQALHSDYDAYEAFTGQLSALISYDSTPIWQKPFTYAYGVRLIGTNEQDYDPATADLRRRTFFIGGLTGQVGIDRTDSLLNATKGFRTTLLVEPEGSLQGGFTPYVRALLDASAYISPTDSIVLAGRVRFGTIQGIDRFDLAPSRRFYAGGGGSVRGFGYQELGPKAQVPNPDFDPTDPDEKDSPFLIRPIGGRSVNEAAAEVRYRFGDFGVVGFVDAGQVYEQSLPQLSDIRFGVGLGARYYTNFGPFRFDIATPINRQPGESKISVYVSIGQAF
ncbi:BamA/TamA family outer membrane protein [Erythrobacter sp. LQ02-29]|uniref:autotransporter assembly complex protein TamA n=1 Tax=Erythrobacter sp. LQ02-29 TaxID=2920384 RepID=UPI001F4D6410|nr:BamA/TamA family outer membrane protein [Erythrobacter sp. LQ02-29]MCP9221564.1 BamA/TamA family outer membrane protein [Erythrobacter sp. LQ02-29]